MHVVRMAEFAWTALEPEEGKYKLDWLQRAVNLAGRHGIYLIIGTPTAGPPVWMAAKYPDIMVTDETGKLYSGLTRNHYNWCSPLNSVIGYNTAILLQSGLSDVQAHWGYVLFTAVNFTTVMVGMNLVDRKGRKFLFVLGTSGIIVAMVMVGLMFLKTEKQSINCRDQIQAMVGADQAVTLRFDKAEAHRLIAVQGSKDNGINPDKASFAVIYSYGDFTASTSYVRSDNPDAAH